MVRERGREGERGISREGGMCVCVCVYIIAYIMRAHRSTYDSFI